LQLWGWTVILLATPQFINLNQGLLVPHHTSNPNGRKKKEGDLLCTGILTVRPQLTALDLGHLILPRASKAKRRKSKDSHLRIVTTRVNKSLAHHKTKKRKKVLQNINHIHTATVIDERVKSSHPVEALIANHQNITK